MCACVYEQCCSLFFLQEELAKSDLRSDLAFGPNLLSTDKGLFDNTMEGSAHVGGDLVLELDDLFGDHKRLVGVPDHKVSIGASDERALDAAQSDLARRVETLPLGQVLDAVFEKEVRNIDEKELLDLQLINWKNISNSKKDTREREKDK